MDFPITPEDLNARQKAYRRERMVVAFFAYAPLLVLYVMTHTSYLRAVLPPSKNLQVLYLIVIPVGWAVLLVSLSAGSVCGGTSWRARIAGTLCSTRN